ncbi:MAG: hypothetical protein FJ014_13390 [Chloroflexi bacterium]|nr:hypothetical protein [Chloroflexota bacterium]
MAIYNHLLFSEIFFQQVRRETADLDNLRATLSTIRDTWQYYLPPPSEWDGSAWVPARPFPPDDVAQLRAHVVESIFAYLELTYGPCEADERAFFLYADWARQDPAALCLVLPYSAHIEGRDPETEIIPKGRNWAQQLIRLLRQYDLDWGVLTNGRHWRLFHRKELSPTETYLHIDLERIIAADDIKNYIVFHRFFSRPAFARQDGRQCLDLYKQQCDEATKVIEDHLSAQVEEIARQLCQGLAESCRDAGEDVITPEIRTEIYKNALFLVYRLLFVLYAEARDLLPLDVPTYRAVCLRDLLAEVRTNHKRGMEYDDDYAMWGRLQALFALIDQGDSVAGVPAYNGGLFDPGRRDFLTEHRIRNDYLQAALIRLSTMPAKGKTYDQDRDPQPIDYRDLSVRHLGSLYEGLLEYNLFVVEDEPRVVRFSQKKTEYVPYSQAGKVRAGETLLQVGDVYFSETAGERKATGSYYTPEDVVDYIVRNTVGEKLKELKAEFYKDHEIEHQLADLADTPPDIPAHRQIQRALDDQFLRFVRERVLDLKILDPAMGSGHFLVNATHAVANFIVELLNETPWENHEVDTDVATWKRQVAERCIFGVDLNELAVELAKLCLWMTTTARGKPLTFLDHHLRWGNSLVGAWLKDVGVYPLAKKESEQAFTLPMERFQVRLDQVLAGYQELYAKSSDEVDEVREKARLFDEEIYPTLQPYRELLDLHTGVYFGNGLDEEAYAQLETVVYDPAAWTHLKGDGLGNLLAQHTDPCWFHWELEFPEVFSQTRRGFDVVIGNPPYVRQERISRQKSFLKTAFNEVYHGIADLYVYFLSQGIKNLASGGFLGFIIANKWLRAGYGTQLRNYLVEQTDLVQLLDFGHSDVFSGTDTFPCILIAADPNGRRMLSRRLFFADVSDQARGNAALHDFVPQHGFEIPISNLRESGWLLESADESRLLDKLQREFPTISELTGAEAQLGIITGLNAAFYVDSLTRNRLVEEAQDCKPLLRRLLRGRTVERWRPVWDETWIIAIPSSSNQSWPWSECGDEQEAEAAFRDIYPSLHKHLKGFEARLRSRQHKGRFWWELRSCDYYDAIEKPKIVVQRILYHSVYSLDLESHWVNDATILLPTRNLYALAILNSRVIWWYLFRMWPHMKDEAVRVQKQELMSLPVPEASADLRSKIEALAQQAYEIAGEDNLAQLFDIEVQMQHRVIEAFELTNAEVSLIERTLPPRDPLVVLEKRLRKSQHPSTGVELCLSS